MTYKDPLHVPYEQLVVKYNGKEVLMLNKALLDQQNCWDNLEAIKDAHVIKLCIYEIIQDEKDTEALKTLAQDLTEIEFYLQELWGFSKDSRYHRFWLYPKCECPKMDNEDDYPHLQYYNAGCPLHGGFDGK